MSDQESVLIKFTGIADTAGRKFGDGFKIVLVADVDTMSDEAIAALIRLKKGEPLEVALASQQMGLFAKMDDNLTLEEKLAAAEDLVDKLAVELANRRREDHTVQLTEDGELEAIRSDMFRYLRNGQRLVWADGTNPPCEVEVFSLDDTLEEWQASGEVEVVVMSSGEVIKMGRDVVNEQCTYRLEQAVDVVVETGDPEEPEDAGCFISDDTAEVEQAADTEAGAEQTADSPKVEEPTEVEQSQKPTGKCYGLFVYRKQPKNGPPRLLVTVKRGPGGWWLNGGEEDFLVNDACYEDQYARLGNIPVKHRNAPQEYIVGSLSDEDMVEIYRADNQDREPVYVSLAHLLEMYTVVTDAGTMAA